ncbi:hypothetical protein [Planctomycetes bacterium K23_9]|uniref:Uncharacterized protein n=1 Tax=Stieleria marina TaxID=1930275 RepID=A0A517NM08_9BACT|nr:hypothetical protein K239x_00500 [Planctomycetes bacterium K23_9]
MNQTQAKSGMKVISAFTVLCGLLVVPFGLPSNWAIADDKQPKLDENPAVVLDVVRLKKSDVTESSGLAVSNVGKNRWWTHNDSGNKSYLYAVDNRGKATGRCRLKGIENKDWEDMASFVHDGYPRLLVADSGNNLHKRKSIELYLLDEPNPDKKTDQKRVQVLHVTFPDQPRDCEAIAVDTERQKVVLITKGKLPYAVVYTIDLPKRNSRPAGDTEKIVAQKATTLSIPMVSGMDIDSKNGDVWIVNYFQAFHFKRTANDQKLSEQFAKLPQIYSLPNWKQVEAVAVDQQHQVWITSEGKSPPLGRLRLTRPSPTNASSTVNE